MVIFRFNSVEENIFYFNNTLLNIGFPETYFVFLDTSTLNDLFQDTDINITLYKSKYDVSN